MPPLRILKPNNINEEIPEHGVTKCGLVEIGGMVVA
jgi:hypothetical protein